MHHRSLVCLAVFLFAAVPLWAQDASSEKASDEAAGAEKAEGSKEPKKPHAWRSMFNGKDLGQWESVNFGGEGEVYVQDRVIVMEMGSDMTGILWKGDLPKMNYEFECEARRTLGIDFFATTTFPYGDQNCSLVVGGWAGTVIGISCVDWYDASDNLTTDFFYFKDEIWYKIRLRVSERKIEAWVDDKKFVDLETKGHKLSIRPEVEPSLPFGISTWCTEGQVRNLRIRTLKPEEVAAIKAEK